MMFAFPRGTILYVALALSALACTSAPDSAASPTEVKAADAPPANDAEDSSAGEDQATASKPDDEPASSRVLFRNVHVFDGRSNARIENTNVLVEGNLIKAISTELSPSEDMTVIEG